MSLWLVVGVAIVAWVLGRSIAWCRPLQTRLGAYRALLEIEDKQ